MQWSDEATVGYNAGANFYANHPLSGLHKVQIIGCVHTDPEDETVVTINNVIYNLVPDTAEVVESTPPPGSTLGKFEFTAS